MRGLRSPAPVRPMTTCTCAAYDHLSIRYSTCWVPAPVLHHAYYAHHMPCEPTLVLCILPWMPAPVQHHEHHNTPTHTHKHIYSPAARSCSLLLASAAPLVAWPSSTLLIFETGHKTTPASLRGAGCTPPAAGVSSWPSAARTCGPHTSLAPAGPPSRVNDRLLSPAPAGTSPKWARAG